MRTEEERKSAVERLKVNKQKCPPRSFFGEDNHEKIDVMIVVIEEDLSESRIYGRYETEDEDGDMDIDSEDQGLVDAALSARGYLDGSNELEDILYPETE